MPSGGRHEHMRTYSPEEAAFVHQCVLELSPQWTLIAKKVSDAFSCNRTAASVRNYYKRFQASKSLATQGIAKNRCQLCNQIKRGHICTPLQTAPSRWCAAPLNEPQSQPIVLSPMGHSPLELQLTTNGSIHLGGTTLEPSPVTLTNPPTSVFDSMYTPPAHTAAALTAAAAPAAEPLPPIARAAVSPIVVAPEPVVEPSPTYGTAPAAAMPFGANNQMSYPQPSPVIKQTSYPPPPAITIDELMADKLFRRDEQPSAPISLASANGLLELSASPRVSFSNAIDVVHHCASPETEA